MHKISIIVPVYNTEKTLPKCLESILANEKDNIEILVINDGRNDKTDKVIDEYKKKYPNIIKYYEKANTGIADTRNYGIEHATGDYIMFVDSDDYIDKDLIVNMSSYLDNNIDLIKYKIIKVDKSGRVLEKINGPVFESMSGEEAFDKLYARDVLIDSPCIYAFKKKLFTKDLKFKVGTEHEDFGLIPLLIVKAKTVVSIDYYGYYYVQSENSIIRNDDYERKLKKMKDSIEHYDNMVKFANKEYLPLKVKKDLMNYYANSIILKLKTLDKKDRKLYIEEIKSREMISNMKSANLKQFIKNMILKVNINWYLKLKK